MQMGLSTSSRGDEKRLATYSIVVGSWSMHSLMTRIVSVLSYNTLSQLIHFAFQHARAAGHSSSPELHTVSPSGRASISMMMANLSSRQVW